jgi:LuxR family maltose regulon positive regulatory protein
VLAGIAILLEHRPPQLHLVLATRVDPPLPMARWRARGDLVELRAADLCCSTRSTVPSVRR